MLMEQKTKPRIKVSEMHVLLLLLLLLVLMLLLHVAAVVAAGVK